MCDAINIPTGLGQLNTYSGVGNRKDSLVQVHEDKPLIHVSQMSPGRKLRAIDAGGKPAESSPSKRQSGPSHPGHNSGTDGQKQKEKRI